MNKKFAFINPTCDRRQRKAQGAVLGAEAGESHHSVSALKGPQVGQETTQLWSQATHYSLLLRTV